MTYHGKLQIEICPHWEKGTEFSWNYEIRTLRFPGIADERNRGCHVNRFLGNTCLLQLVALMFHVTSGSDGGNRRLMPVLGYVRKAQKSAFTEIKSANGVFQTRHGGHFMCGFVSLFFSKPETAKPASASPSLISRLAIFSPWLIYR